MESVQSRTDLGKMARFVLLVIAGCIGPGIFYCFLPIVVARSVDVLIPFGFTSLENTTRIRIFFAACVLFMGPINILSVVRIARRWCFQANDGRPALFGVIEDDDGAVSAYGRRARWLLFLTSCSIALAFFVAWMISTSLVDQISPLIVLYACLGFTFFGLSAIEVNDLRRAAVLRTRIDGT